MSDITLVLGPIVFRDYEIPSGIRFGGAQRLVVHQLANGGRVIDALGRDDMDICFEGVFAGSDATLRARALDELRASGSVLPLTWDVFFYSAIIRQFVADYTTGWWIPYRLACTVLRDEAAALIETAATLATQVVTDLAVAAAQSLPLGVDLSSVQAALSAPSATILGSSAFTTALAGLQIAQASTGSTIGSAEAALGASVLPSTGSAAEAVSALPLATGAAQTLAGLTVANSYLGRAFANLTSAST